MAESDPFNILTDPLGVVSRKERRNLLITSTIGICVALLGLVPTQISALGIEFTPPRQTRLVWLAAVIVFYFLAAFAVYGVADYFIWRKRLQDYRVHMETEQSNWSLEDQEAQDELGRAVPPIRWFYSAAQRVASARIVVEIALPLLIGSATFVLLVIRALR